METEYLFVYGTLLSRANNSMSEYLWKHSELVETGYFQGKLFKVSWYPGAVLSDKNEDKVHGSVFKVLNVESVIKSLDDYEGIEEQLYKRQLVKVFLNNGSEEMCWVYLYNQPTSNLKQIISGDFFKP